MAAFDVRVWAFGVGELLTYGPVLRERDRERERDRVMRERGKREGGERGREWLYPEGGGGKAGKQLYSCRSI